MQTWKWLYDPQTPFDWRFIRNVVVKAAILFVGLNLVFVLFEPLPFLGRLSAYNIVLDGRERLPYGENPGASYNLSLYQIDAMFASHKLDGADHDGEYRVLLMGDSSIWGFLLEPDDTLAGQINAQKLTTADGLRIRAYNLGYPTMSLTKDLMLLKFALDYEPNLVVWSLTLESFGRQTQLDSAIVKNNAAIVRDLIETYDLQLDPDDSQWVDYSTWDNTIMGRRRALADILRLQLYGVPWSVTGIDQEYPDDYTPRTVDFEESDRAWQGYEEGTLTDDDLVFDVLRAGVEMIGDTPVLLINEPMLISEGENSHIRYNSFYPRWAYDLYWQRLGQISVENNWELIDLWDTIPSAACYTDSPVHLTPDCSAQLGEIVGAAIISMADTGTVMSPENE